MVKTSYFNFKFSSILVFNLPDQPITLPRHFLPTKCQGNSFNRLQLSNNSIQPAEDVSGIDVYIIISHQFSADIHWILLQNTIFKNSPGKFSLKTGAERSLFTMAGEKFHLQVHHLLLEGRI